MAEYTDKITLKRDMYDAAARLSDERFGRLFRAIFAYAFDGDEPDLDDDEALSMLMDSHRDDFTSSVAYHRTQFENGVKGGRPKGSTTSRKSGRKTHPKTDQKPTQKPTQNRPKSVSKYVSTTTTYDTYDTYDANEGGAALTGAAPIDQQAADEFWAEVDAKVAEARASGADDQD